MKRKMIVTEDNFSKVLERLQKTCIKHKMLKFYKMFSEDMKEQKEYRRTPFGFDTRVKPFTHKDGRPDYKTVHRFYMSSDFVDVNKHHFRVAYENDSKDSPDYSEQLNYKLYLEMKSLIHLDTGLGTALVISVGDKVEFLPFGGFIIWNDNSYTRGSNPLHLYKYTFIPDFITGKITDIEEERNKRIAEWKDYDDCWDDFDADDNYDGYYADDFCDACDDEDYYAD